MRAIVQRVQKAHVVVNYDIVGKINQGLLVFVGIGHHDNTEDIKWMASKIISLRIFADEEGKMNKNIIEAGGELLLVSQFTLYASTTKGNRPSFTESAPAHIAYPLFNQFITLCESLLPKKIQTGIFGANMQVHLINDGPVTIWLDSKNR